MLGPAQAAHLAGGAFTATATRVADWYPDHVPADNVCFQDFDDPAIRHAPDTAAATERLCRALPASQSDTPEFRIREIGAYRLTNPPLHRDRARIGTRH
jgi:hypothetical protein